jgi:hypothetical protein
VDDFTSSTPNALEVAFTVRLQFQPPNAEFRIACPGSYRHGSTGGYADRGPVGRLSSQDRWGLAYPRPRFLADDRAELPKPRPKEISRRHRPLPINAPAVGSGMR